MTTRAVQYLFKKLAAKASLTQNSVKRSPGAGNSGCPATSKAGTGRDTTQKRRERNRKFADSLLEGAGFEPSVPRRGQHFFEDKPAR